MLAKSMKYQRDIIPTELLSALLHWIAIRYRDLVIHSKLNDEEKYTFFMLSDHWGWTPFPDLEDWAMHSMSREVFRDMLDKFVRIKIMEYRGKDGNAIPPEQRFHQDTVYHSYPLPRN